MRLDYSAEVVQHAAFRDIFVRANPQGIRSEGLVMNAHSRYAIALIVSQLACSLIAGCRPATNTNKPDVTDERRTTHALLAGASPHWGLLVAPQSGLPTPIKSTYFFPGAPISGALRNWTFMPIDTQYLYWTTSAASRAFIVGQMAQVGVNAIIMSYYHTYCCAPMEQYVDAQGHSTGVPGAPNYAAYDGVFDAVSRSAPSLQIIPSVELPDGPAAHFAKPNDTFARDAIEALVVRYLVNPANPQWPSHWGKVYDFAGNPRYAVEMINIASDSLLPSQSDQFYEAFNSLESYIRTKYHKKIGFLVGPGTPTGKHAPGHGYTPTPPRIGHRHQPPGTTLFQKVPSFLAIQDYFSEIRIGAPLFFSNPYADNNGLLPPEPPRPSKYILAGNRANREELARFKRDNFRGWIAAKLPVILDVSGGYDGRYVFGWERAVGSDRITGYWGDNATYYDDYWRNYMSQMKGMGNVGITYSSWNAFTEGGTAMPAHRVTRAYTLSGLEKDSYGTFNLAFVSDGSWDYVRYNWLTDLYSVDPRKCDHWQYVNGVRTYHVYGAICQKWQKKGGQIDFGAPTSSEEATWGAQNGRPNTAGNRVVYFSRGGSLSAIFFKPGAGEAFEVFGAIYNKYVVQMGEDYSYLGMPTSGELDSIAWCANGKYNAFEHGWIDYCPDGRVWAHSDPAQGYPGRNQ